MLAQLLANLKPGVGDSSSCAPDQVAFAIPQSTGGYFPNPANKDIAAPDLCYQPGRVVVVRGKAGVFPDTYNGAPVWQPPGQYAKIDTTLDALEGEVEGWGNEFLIGQVGVACGLGYLDFRFGHRPWRPARPSVAAWFDNVSTRPSMQATRPG